MNYGSATRITREAVKAYAPEVVLATMRQFKYRNEIKLFRGQSLTNSTKRSICFFTTHKCASTYTERAIDFLNKKCLGLTHVDVEHYLYSCSKRNSLHEVLEEHKQIVFRPEGLIYGPFRGYFPVPSNIR